MASGIIYVRKDSDILVEATSDLKKSVAWHYKAAAEGIHPNPELNGDIKVDIMRKIRRAKGESDESHRRRIKKDEADILKLFREDGVVCLNPRWKARGVVTRRDFKPRKSMVGTGMGNDNPASKTVEVRSREGRLIHFGSVSDCARFFCVSQQVMSRWLLVRWPGGKGGRNRSITTLIAARYSARFVDTFDAMLAWDRKELVR